MEAQDRVKRWKEYVRSRRHFYRTSGVMVVGVVYLGYRYIEDTKRTMLGPNLVIKLISSENLYACCARLVKTSGVLWVEPIYQTDIPKDMLEVYHYALSRSLREYRIIGCREDPYTRLKTADKDCFSFSPDMLWSLASFMSDFGLDPEFSDASDEHIPELLSTDEVYRYNWFEKMCRFDGLEILDDPETQSLSRLTIQRLTHRLLSDSETESETEDETSKNHPKTNYQSIPASCL